MVKDQAAAVAGAGGDTVLAAKTLSRSVGRCVTALVAVGLVLAGCGTPTPSATHHTPRTARTSPPTPTAPALVSSCTFEQTGWSALAGTPVDAATTGRGPLVVLANESGNNVCAGLPLADRLAASGHRVAVFAYTDTSATGEPQALSELLAVAALARNGGRWVAVGASLGGRLVIEAAAKRPTGLAGVVSLSGETVVQDYRDITPDAKRVTTPALVVGSAFDPLTDQATQTKALHAAMHGSPNELLVVPTSSDHGFQLVDPATGADKATIERVAAFVSKRLAG